MITLAKNGEVGLGLLLIPKVAQGNLIVMGPMRDIEVDEIGRQPATSY